VENRRAHNFSKTKTTKAKNGVSKLRMDCLVVFLLVVCGFATFA
jgi:hypothetical protein